ncbi:MAG: O-antigen ligase [Pseudomonas sp.]
MPVPVGSRAAVAFAEAGLFLLGAGVLAFPGGLLPFGLCLLVSSLLGLGALRRGAGTMGRPLQLLAGLSLAVLVMALVSLLLFEHDLRDVGNRSRFVVLPWVAIWAYSLRPRLAWLWRGALAGIAAALALAAWQVLGGAPRAEGWSNAIVFADVVLSLMILAVFCRPRRRWVLPVFALLAGCATIVLSGSRGVWLGLLCLLVVIVWSARWRDGRSRLLVLSGVAVVAIGLLLTVPGLSRQMRLVELQTDMQRLEHGDADSSAGARLELWQAAYESFLAHPLTGIGIGHFDEAMKQQPACRADSALEYCNLGHAHNDLAEWGATQGVPGLLLLVAVYGLPLLLMVRLHRDRAAPGESPGLRGAAAAGAMLVVGYVLCGMTQSMFAHQLTVSVYVSLVGILAGLALREAHDRRAMAGTPNL